MSESTCKADGLTCSSFQVLLVRFDTIGETHLSFHTHGFASVMLALMLRLLQVDFDRVEGHVGVELCNISGPGERETITANSEHTLRNVQMDASRAWRHILNAELFEKHGQQSRKERSPSAKSMFNSKPLGRWSILTI